MQQTSRCSVSCSCVIIESNLRFLLSAIRPSGSFLRPVYVNVRFAIILYCECARCKPGSVMYGTVKCVFVVLTVTILSPLRLAADGELALANHLNCLHVITTVISFNTKIYDFKKSVIDDSTRTI